MKTKKKPATQPQTNGSSGSPNCEEIAFRAYLLWEQEGRPANHDLAHWLQAEAQLQQGSRQDTVSV